MKIREVRVGYGVTANAGNYNSERVDVWLTAELEPLEVDTDATVELLRRARAEVQEQLAHSLYDAVKRFAAVEDPQERDTPF